jgi:integrase
LNNDAVLALRDVEGIHATRCFTYQDKRMEAVGSAWERSLKRAGIEKFRFHDLRHYSERRTMPSCRWDGASGSVPWGH